MKKVWSEVYISVDIEASGPIPGEFSMLSIGACVINEPELTFYAELKPYNNHFLAKSMGVNGLFLEKLAKEGEEIALAIAHFEAWILKVAKGNRPVLVAHNATFDWSFTHWYFMKFLGRDPFGISGIDIKAYYMGKLNTSWGETTKKKMDPKFRSNKKHTHNALDDALEQAEIFKKLLGYRI